MTETSTGRFGWLRTDQQRRREYGYDDPTPNLPLLRDTVAWVETEAAKPEAERTWQQQAWRSDLSDLFPDMEIEDCGTAYCLAGYACELTDAKWIDNEYVEAVPDDPEHQVDQEYGKWSNPGGVGTPAIFVSERARRLLGLTGDESRCLFEGSNSAADIREIAEIIAERAGETL